MVGLGKQRPAGLKALGSPGQVSEVLSRLEESRSHRLLWVFSPLSLIAGETVYGRLIHGQKLKYYVIL